MLCHKSPVNNKNTFKIEIVFDSYNDISVVLPTSASTEHLTLTVDTAAQISVIRPNKLHKNLKINNLEKVSVTGIAEKIQLTTLGSVHVKLDLNDFPISHKFHVLNNGFRLRTDGILGIDFLQIYNAKIDFLNRKLQLNVPFKNFSKKTTTVQKPVQNTSYLSVL